MAAIVLPLRDQTEYETVNYNGQVNPKGVYADNLGGEVKHYRDNSGLECDAVVHLEDGRWGGIEIKLGGAYKREDGVCVAPINMLKP